MIADLYDFDKTVYPKESGTAFWKFCLKRKPWLLIYLPLQIWGGLCFFAKIGDSAKAKSLILSFAHPIDREAMAKAFWKENQKNIYPWFHPKNHDLPTVICSASPDFLLEPLCENLGVTKLICTKTEKGKVMGKNCKGAEKVCRLKSELPDWEYRNVYSDNPKSDAPILRLGEQAFQVKNGERINITSKIKGE